MKENNPFGVLAKNKEKSARQKRLAEQIFRELRNQILLQAKDNILKNTSIQMVDITRDLSFARIYVHFLDFLLLSKNKNDLETKKLIEQRINHLNHSVSFFRSHLAQELKIYKVPKLQFIYDDTSEQKQQIDQLLEKIKTEKLKNKKSKK